MIGGLLRGLLLGVFAAAGWKWRGWVCGGFELAVVVGGLEGGGAGSLGTGLENGS